MSTLAHVLNMWDWQMPDGRSIKKGVSYLFPAVKDKSLWTYPADVMYFDQWPIAQSFLYFSAIHGDDNSLALWKKLDHFPTNQEVIRNFPIRNPILWNQKSF